LSKAPTIKKNRFYTKLQNKLWFVFLETLGFFGLVRFESRPAKKNIYNRALIFFEEAKNQKLDIYAIKALGKYTNDFKFIVNGKSYYFESVPITVVGEHNYDIDGKAYIKKFLKNNNFPYAAGDEFINKKHAFEFAKKIGFPIVIKPTLGSLSQHASYPIKNFEQLDDAIKIAKKYSPGFILEKFIYGDLFRVTVVGNNKIYVAKKEKPNVIGDGKRNIKQLINNKNNLKNREPKDKKNSTLHQITIDYRLKEYLENQNYNLKSIPNKDQKVYLSNKYVLSEGCDVIGCSKLIHSNTKKMFFKLTKKLKTDLVGFDFICKDIEKDYSKQDSAIIEANSMPYIDMHQNPSSGESDNVAKDVWKLVLSRL
jgi:D-alanine-D-alanine ligase-like ATP-grasp enzyme